MADLVATKPIRFDPLRRPSAEIAPAVERIIFELLQTRSRYYRRTDEETFRAAVSAIISNCMAVSKIRRGKLAVPRSNGVLRGGCRRYRPRCFGKPFVEAQDLLAELGLIEFKSWGFAIRKQKRLKGKRVRPRYTTLVPTQKLGRLVPLGDRANWSMFTRVEPVEVIVLKRNKKGSENQRGDATLIDYEETEETRRWRSEMQGVNQWLAKAPISFATKDHALVHLNDHGGMQTLVTPDSRALKRVFNDGLWTHGGRASGAFYQSMTNKNGERCRLIRLNEEETVEVDLSAFNLRCAWALSGSNFPFNDDADGGYAAGSYGDREGWKLVTTALIGSTKPIVRWPGKTVAARNKVRDHFPHAIAVVDVVSAIKQKHSGIIQYFEQGYGVRFQRIESDIMIRVLLALRARGIVALPVYDGAICQASHALEVQMEMEAASKAVLATFGLAATIPARIKQSAQ